MKIKDLYEVLDVWTTVSIEDLDSEKEVYGGLITGLELGIKDEKSENVLFDESLAETLNMKVVEIEIIGENRIRVVALREDEKK